MTPAWDTQCFEHLRACATVADLPREGGDAHGDVHGPPWTTQVIKAIIKCSADMQNDLCRGRLVWNFVEWCDTPVVRNPGFATTDGCWILLDETDARLRSVAPCATNDVPHLCKANKERVMEFLRTTFFGNALALECQLAAMCLALGRISTVRACHLGFQRYRSESEHSLYREHVRPHAWFRGQECVLHGGRAQKADRKVHREGVHMSNE